MKTHPATPLFSNLAIAATCLVASFAAFGGYDENASAEAHRPNILFISVDDLGTWLGTYGKPYVHSPHIDRLAQDGMQFNRAYVQVPVCGASRASMMTGLLPTRTRFTSAQSSVDKDAPRGGNATAISAEKGYHTISYGKVLHSSSDTKERSWSEPPVVPGSDMYEWGERGFVVFHTFDPESRNYVMNRTGRGPIYEHPNVPDDAYFDGQVARLTIDKLREFEQRQEPFFLAAGFFNPHLPFYAPKRYWDLYGRAMLSSRAGKTATISLPSAFANAASLRSAATKKDTVNGAIWATAMGFRPRVAAESSSGRKTYAQANGFPPRCHRQF